MHATPPAPYFKHANRPIFGDIKYIAPPPFSQNLDLWAAVFTFNPYLLISINEIIDINNSFIDINKYGHSIHLY